MPPSWFDVTATVAGDDPYHLLLNTVIIIIVFVAGIGL
jgi:hypothetical protein